MINNHPLKNYANFVSEKSSFNKTNPFDYVTTDSILQNKQGITNPTSFPAKSSRVSKYNTSDILLGNIRPYLKKIWLSNKTGGCSSDVLVIRPNEGINPTFLYYALIRDDFFSHIMKGSKGTKMPRGDKNQIMEFLIPEFDRPLQDNIASVLSSLDSKIEFNNRINIELESFAKTIYDYWFMQFNFPDSNSNPYQASGGKMFFNEQLKRQIPEGWKVGSLWDIATYFNGLPMQKFRPTTEEFLPVIKIKEMNEGLSNQTEKASINIPKEAIINDGDILFSWSATLDLKVWSRGKAALNQHIFKVTSSTYPKTFYFFELKNYLNHFKMMADLRKTTMGHITQDHLKQSLICIPPVEILKTADEYLEPIFKKYISFIILFT
jgi:type I restriction enzyme S subunit